MAEYPEERKAFEIVGDTGVPMGPSAGPRIIPTELAWRWAENTLARASGG